MYIVSLALADLTVGLIVMPISAIYIFTQKWLFGVAVCQFWMGVDYTASSASIFNLFILSLDRYWSVTSPLRYLRKRTKKRALIMITFAWFVSVLWLIPIIGWHHFEHSGIRTVPDNVCDTEYATNTVLKIITGLLNFYLPLAVMYALYTKIFLEIKKRSKLEVGQKNRGGSYRKPTKEPFSNSVSNDTQNSDPSAHSPHPKHPDLVNGHSQSRTKECLLESKVQNHETITPIPDEQTPLNSKPYLRSLLCAKQTNTSADSDTSECEPHAYYAYDEVVIDPKTEQLHRYCFEERNHKKLVNNRSVIIKRPELFSDLKETCLCSSSSVEHEHDSIEHGSIEHGSIEHDSIEHDSIEHGEVIIPAVQPSHTQHSTIGSSRVLINVTDNHNDGTPQHKYPKENHPAKNHYIKNNYFTPENSAHKLHAQNSHAKSVRPHSVCMRSSKPNASNVQRPQSLPSAQNGIIENVSNNSNNCFLTVSQSTPSPTSSLMRRIRHTLRNKETRAPSSLQKEIKAARQLGVIMGAFTLCFLPYFICFMVVAFCESCVSSNLLVTVTWIGYLNSTLNPFLYPLCNATFRRKFRKMLHIGPKDKRQSYYLGSMHRGGTIRR